MAQDNTLLLNVARNLRYRTLAPMVGQSITISARALITAETEAFVGRFADDCLFAGPEQEYLDGQIAKYGILDLRFSAPTTLLDADTDSGVPLLRQLGFIDDDARDSIDELGDDGSCCLEELRDGIAENKTHLLLFLVSPDLDVSEMLMMDRMARIQDPSIIDFPIVFSVVDACVSNSSFVWINKHFYM